MLLAQAENLLGQVGAAIVAGLLVLIPLAFLWARHWAAAKVAEAQATALEAEVRLLKAQKEAAEARRLSDALVTKIEQDTKPLSEEEAKKTKGAFRAVAALAGADELLSKTVNRLGFSKSNSEVQAPPLEDVK